MQTFAKIPMAKRCPLWSLSAREGIESGMRSSQRIGGSADRGWSQQ